MDGPIWKGSLTRKRVRPKPSAEPSQFKWTKERSEASLKREKRQKEREAKKQLMFTLPSTARSENELQQDNEQIFQQSHACPLAQVVDSMDVGEEVILQISSNPAAGADFLAVNLDAMDVEEVLLQTSSGHPVTRADCLAAGQPRTSRVQADIKTFPFFSFEALEFDNDLLHYYTGLEPPQKCVAVFQSLGPAVNYLSYYRIASVEKLTPMNQFLLLLAKLRQDVNFLPLARMCGVSMFTAENVFITWVNFCSRQWWKIDTWVKGELVRYYAPSDFMEKFPNIDGTEIPIERPSNPFSQRATFSTYKNKNTIKCLVGCTPGGLVSYISPAYGGSASDRQITERSDLLHRCDRGDSIMEDKGFNVQDLFALRDVEINIPTFFKRKKPTFWRPSVERQKNFKQRSAH